MHKKVLFFSVVLKHFQKPIIHMVILKTAAKYAIIDK